MAGCSGSPVAVRGSQVEGLDQDAFGTGLDKHDLQTLLHDNMKAFDNSAILRRWRTENRPSVAVIPMRNETSEHVDGALEALSSDIETLLIEKGEVRVISLDRQPEIMNETRRQHGGGYDPAHTARWGKQVGAQYLVTGKVFSSDERFGDELEGILAIDEESRNAWEDARGAVIASAITRMLTRLVAGEVAEAVTKSATDNSVLGLLVNVGTQTAMTAADTPDTRCWATLPARMAFSRVGLPPGRHWVDVAVSGVRKRQLVTMAPNGWAVVNLTVLN